MSADHLVFTGIVAVCAAAFFGWASRTADSHAARGQAVIYEGCMMIVAIIAAYLLGKAS